MQIASLKSPDSRRFAWLLPKKSSPLTRFVGIDLGIDVAHIVALGERHRDTTRDRRHDGSLRWLSEHRFSLPIDPLSPPPTDWVQKMTATLADKLPRCVDGDNNVVAVSLPLPWIHYQVNSVAELNLCQQQCDAMFASSLFHSSAHLSYWPSRGDQYMVAAIAESAAYQVAGAIGELGYDVQCMLPHGQALVGAAAAMTGLQPSCVVQLNQAGGLISINHQGRCGLCRTLPPIPASVLAASSHGILLDDLGSWLDIIAAEINATIRYASVGCASHHDSQQPILICGEIAKLDRLDSVLAGRLNRPVAKWQYLGKSRPSAPQDSAPADSQYALALSLAYAAAKQLTGGDNE